MKKYNLKTSNVHFYKYLSKILFIATVFFLSCNTISAQAGYRFVKFTALSTDNLKIMNIDWISGSILYPDQDMTSNNSHGIVASATVNGEAYLAFDSNMTAGPWIGERVPYEITLDFGNASISPSGISIVISRWGDLFAFSCEGSNDGISWTLLHEEYGLTEDDFPNNIGVFQFDAVQPVPVTGITLNTAVLDLVVGETHKLSASLLPADATNQNISWESDDHTVAQVDANGIVSAVNTGRATITVTSEDGSYTDTCEVTVYDSQTTNLLSNGDFSNGLSDWDLMANGASASASVVDGSVEIDISSAGNDAWEPQLVQDGFAIQSGVEYTVSFQAAATADRNIILYINSGPDAYTALYRQAVSLTTDFQSFSYSFVAGFSDDNARIDFNCGGSSSQNVFLDNVSLVAGDGTTIDIPVTGVSISPSNLNLSAGGSNYLSFAIEPSNATNQNVIWESDNTSVATINAQGRVSAIAEGTANISITTQDGGYEDVCTVNVDAAVPLPDTGKQIGMNFWFNASWSNETPYINNVDFEAAWNSGKSNGVVNTNIWHPDFLDDIASYAVLRPMEWQLINYTVEDAPTLWANRRLPTDPNNKSPEWHHQKGGVAYEWLIDLANRTGKDLWICVPHYVDESVYWPSLAQLLYDNLNPELKLYIEYSNEVWNGSFDQTIYAREKGLEMGFPSPDLPWEAGWQYSAYQHIKLFEAFENVFGKDNPRLVKTLGGWSDNTYVTGKMLDVFDNPSLNPNGTEADGFAVAPYVGHSGDGASSDIWNVLYDGLDKMVSKSIGHLELIAPRGWRLFAYEAGQHVTTNPGPLNTDPRIYDFYMDYLDQLMPHYDVFVMYCMVSDFDANYFGLKSYTGQPLSDAHKARALEDWMAQNLNP